MNLLIEQPGHPDIHISYEDYERFMDAYRAEHAAGASLYEFIVCALGGDND